MRSRRIGSVSHPRLQGLTLTQGDLLLALCQRRADSEKMDLSRCTTFEKLEQEGYVIDTGYVLGVDRVTYHTWEVLEDAGLIERIKVPRRQVDTQYDYYFMARATDKAMWRTHTWTGERPLDM
jgi:hypothetical protein